MLGVGRVPSLRTRRVPLRSSASNVGRFVLSGVTRSYRSSLFLPRLPSAPPRCRRSSRKTSGLDSARAVPARGLLLRVCRGRERDTDQSFVRSTHSSLFNCTVDTLISHAPSADPFCSRRIATAGAGARRRNEGEESGGSIGPSPTGSADTFIELGSRNR